MTGFLMSIAREWYVKGVFETIVHYFTANDSQGLLNPEQSPYQVQSD